MFLFIALFVIEGDKFSSHGYWLPCTAYLPTILDIFHFDGRVAVTLIINAIMWLTRANANSSPFKVNWVQYKEKSLLMQITSFLIASLEIERKIFKHHLVSLAS